MALVPIALVGAYTLQLNGLPPSEALLDRWQAVPLLMLMAGLLCLALGIHKVQLKAYESRAIRLSAVHAVVMGIATAIVDDMANGGIPAATFITFGLLYFFLTTGSRFLLLQIVLAIYRRNHDQVRVIIYGAGRTGQQLAAALSTDDRIQPVAFVDDDKSLQSTIVRGLSVYSPLTIPALIRDKGAHRVLLAMPSVPRTRINQLSRQLEDMGVEAQTLPSFAQLAGTDTQLLVEQLRPVTPSRLLRRAPLDAELPGGSETYVGRSVMVSGGGGSIGSELCRQLIRCRPAKLVMVEFSELALYSITNELEPLAQANGVTLVPILASAGEAALMRKVLTDHAVEIVLHAAAYKHVPIVEHNPVAGLANNVLGTQVLAQAALDCGVERFILISSDKAVRPRNMMGASKRLAELVVQDLAQRAQTTGGRTIFSMVRFGNVMNSSGSVIPLFHEQISKGGPVTVTHRAVTRYFMTIPEAARLVLVAGTFAEGGEVFVLDMGEPIAIYDLARQMIEAMGHQPRTEETPDGDIEIRITGLRPGEKLHEELLIGQGQLTTPHPKILLARETKLSEIEVAAALKALRGAVAEADVAGVRSVVARFVEGGEAIVAREPSAPAQPPANVPAPGAAPQPV
nr:nucleoside-diphosphate sugar epimerase/dehydratase [Wenxinia marina]